MLNLESILIDVAAVVEVKRRNQNLMSLGHEIGYIAPLTSRPALCILEPTLSLDCAVLNLTPGRILRVRGDATFLFSPLIQATSKPTAIYVVG
jgi:hypothetical protein